MFAAKFTPNPFEIFNGTKNTCNAFMVLRPCFEFTGELIGGWAHFVGKQFFKQFMFTKQNARMRTEEFISR